MRNKSPNYLVESLCGPGSCKLLYTYVVLFLHPSRTNGTTNERTKEAAAGNETKKRTDGKRTRSGGSASSSGRRGQSQSCFCLFVCRALKL